MLLRKWSSFPEATPSAVIAIPARNEEVRIASCLLSCGHQSDSDGAISEDFGVVVVTNNCSDQTFSAAVAAAKVLRIPVQLFDIRLDHEFANAGGARRLAMELAAEWIARCHDDGLILTTDADSRPAYDWVAVNRRAIIQGADCIAGTIRLDTEEASLLPDSLHRRGQREAEYERILTEIFTMLDPRPHDPWPRHSSEPGASLAVTLKAYRAVGGLPRLSSGEDRAFASRLDAAGYRVRHDPSVRVITSGRLIGRAEGGVADTLRLRCEEPDAPCDPYLEPALNAQFRGLWRGRLRQLHGTGRLETSAWRGALGLRGNFLRGAAQRQSFADLWNAIEAASRPLTRELIVPAQLEEEIAKARLILRSLLRQAPFQADCDQAAYHHPSD